jgi:hypothetical protein
MNNLQFDIIELRLKTYRTELKKKYKPLFLERHVTVLQSHSPSPRPAYMRLKANSPLTHVSQDCDRSLKYITLPFYCAYVLSFFLIPLSFSLFFSLSIFYFSLSFCALHFSYISFCCSVVYLFITTTRFGENFFSWVVI